MVQAGTFREDLLFRLKTLSVHLPPLRTRKADLKPLALFHVSRLCEQYGMPLKGFGSDFFDVLAAYRWPGNVRELFNVLERAFVAAGEERTLYAMHLPQEVRIQVTKASLGRPEGAPREPRPGSGDPDAAPAAAAADGAQRPQGEARPQDPAPAADAMIAAMDAFFVRSTPSLKEFKNEMERRYLEYLLAMHGANTKAILRDSGLSRSHFYALLKKNGIGQVPE
jgi:two-component system NtrC family response regulator